MRKHFIFIGILFILNGCFKYEKEICKKGFSEKHYDFLSDIKRQPDFDYLKAIADFRQFGAYSENLWLRKPENLKRVYASLTQLGLKRFISEQEFNQPLFTDHWAKTSWANKSLNRINKKLIQSHANTSGFDKYYIDFWNRRKADTNESVVIKILMDIDSIYNFDRSSGITNWQSESTITGLLEFEIKLKLSDSLTQKQIKIDYYNYLKTVGLYASANNLVRYESELIVDGELEEQNNDYLELIHLIEIDSVSCENYWNWRQSAKWFNEVYDNGH